MIKDNELNKSSVHVHVVYMYLWHYVFGVS